MYNGDLRCEACISISTNTVPFNDDLSIFAPLTCLSGTSRPWDGA